MKTKYHQRKIAVVGDKFWKKDASFLLWFGQCSSIYILAYGHLEDCIEDCGDYLAENAPVNIIPHGSAEMDELYRNACEELGIDYDTFDHASDIGEKVREIAESDLTYTESGWITSYEWGIVMENPTKKFLVEFHRNEI